MARSCTKIQPETRRSPQREVATLLTGIITSLLAQGYGPVEAAFTGVYLHGLTADIALPATGYQAFIASDIIHNLGKAWLSLTSL